MNTAALRAIISLINQVSIAAEALQGVSNLIQQRQAAGEDVTIDDLKAMQLQDDQAADALRQAIEDAEAG